ncbi:hypothetical protein F5Y10DRAFT_288411 [Nemania abortiva]|nr:hypothetical protein F5Y10DRAFT_288411 [Nemania abortiva]
MDPPPKLPSPAAESPPESKTKSSENFEFDEHDTPPDPDADIANIHASNKELREREATKACFQIFDKLDSLASKESRDQIGSIPSEWCDEAIPLFEHNDTDYQLHFSYTWLEVHDPTNEPESEPEAADWDLHRLAGVTEEGIQIIANPFVVIPIGKLFVNKSGSAIWTGYEMFISGSLEVWMIYVPTEHDTVTWNTADAGLFAHPGDQSDQAGKCKMARFCRSLRGLKTATFEAVQKEAASTAEWLYTGFYLIELSTSDIEASRLDENNTEIGAQSNIANNHEQTSVSEGRLPSTPKY